MEEERRRASPTDMDDHTPVDDTDHTTEQPQEGAVAVTPEVHVTPTSGDEEESFEMVEPPTAEEMQAEEARGECACDVTRE